MTRRVYFIVFGIGLLCLVGCLVALRQNKITANDKAMAILKADQAGQDTTAAIGQLKQFVSQNMNSSVDFMLDSKLRRDIDKTLKQPSSNSPVPFDTDVYKEAAKNCPARQDSVATTKCIQDFVSKNNTPAPTPAVPAPKLPDRNDYSYKFISPQWVVDLSTILGGVGGLLVIRSLLGLAITQMKKPPTTTISADIH